MDKQLDKQMDKKWKTNGQTNEHAKGQMRTFHCQKRTNSISIGVPTPISRTGYLLIGVGAPISRGTCPY